MINQIRNQMKTLPDDAILGDEFFKNWKEIWENDNAETIDADLPGAMFDSRANVEAFFKTAVEIANRRGKPLVLIGRFDSSHNWNADYKGQVARALLKLKTPLKIAFTSQFDTNVVMLNQLLSTMVDVGQGNMELKSVELDRIVSASNGALNQELLTKLGDLGAETVTFSHLDDATIERRRENPGTKEYEPFLEKFNAWNGELDFCGENREAWKHLLKKVKFVDLRNNINDRGENKIPPKCLNNLKNLLVEIRNERARAADAEGVQQPEAIALQSILLPDDVDGGLSDEIKSLVNELKGN